MEILELNRLAKWYVDHFSHLQGLYQGLIGPIQHNASQPNKLPVEGPLNDLIQYLSDMNLGDLSLQQIAALDKIGLNKWIGKEGALTVEQTIRTAAYDPATALNILNQAFNQLSNTNGQFNTLVQTSNQLSLIDENSIENQDGYVTVRVGFQSEASISNVSELKNQSDNWYDIIYGVALANNEAPEETKIVGATNGSIILILVATIGVTKMLATISGHVSKVAMHGLEVAHSMADLRKKNLLNQVIETELKEQVQKHKDEAVEQIVGELKPLLPDESGDKIPALKRSIKKLLEFNEKGGNVDFVEPEGDQEPAAGEENAPSGPSTQFAEVRAAIRGYQTIRENIKLLADGTGGK